MVVKRNQKLKKYRSFDEDLSETKLAILDVQNMAINFKIEITITLNNSENQLFFL